MNPYKYLDTMTSQIQEQIIACDKTVPSILDTKLFTQRDYLEKISGFISSLRNIIDNSYFTVVGKTHGGEEIGLRDFKCKRSEIEDLIFVQPSHDVSKEEYGEIMDALSLVYSKGALNNKMLLMLPHDIALLQAKIKVDE